MEIHCAYTDLVEIPLLIPNPRNPNQHPEAQIELLAKILKYQGWRNPIVVSKRSGFIVKGHGRLEAAKLNGWESVPVDRQDYATEADEWADMIADNKIAELAQSDDLEIKEMALEMGPDFDLDLLGMPHIKLALNIDTINSSDENAEWVGLPEFEPGGKYINLIYQFKTELERELYVKDNKITVDFKKSNQWIIFK